MGTRTPLLVNLSVPDGAVPAFFFASPPESAFSSTRAYIFSYSRGTESTMVGRTVAMSIGTVSIDSAYAIEQPTWNIR